jgi:hypothetical protein
MDFASLRQEGILALEQMTGRQWTDFNVHDPGITILEQLCYALTDLAYRTGYDIPDLLADGGGDPNASIHPPAEILTSRPVTPDDLRKLVIDVDGVKNAWVERFEGDNLAIYYHLDERALRFSPKHQPPPPPSELIELKGLYRVLFHAQDHLRDDERGALKAKVARRLHENRNLCEDFARVEELTPKLVQVDATVEIGPLDDVDRLAREIFQVLADTISPRVPFATLDEMLEAGRSLDEIFDGPRLERGFIKEDALERATRRVAINTSDLVRAIRDVSGVRAVSRIRVSKDQKTWQSSSLEIERDNVAKLDPVSSKLTFRREGGKKVVVHAAEIALETSAAPPRAKADGGLSAVAPPSGRDRDVSRYTSVQMHLPALYGVGELGLPGSAPPERKAQAKQLKAYLMFFDQLMADYLAQLAHVKDLFSYDGSEAQTYFTQLVSDQPGLGLAAIRGLDVEHEEELKRLAERSETRGAFLERRGRFLNHLLARFAEVLDEGGAASTEALGASGASRAEARADALAQVKRVFLQDYPRLSGARGAAYNYLEAGEGDPSGAAGRRPLNPSGFERRLRLKLGLDNEEVPIIVEHILLRPVEVAAEGNDVEVAPLLSDPVGRDPYSLQVTFVFPGAEGRFQDDEELRRRVEQTIRAETPAHLSPYVRWMDAVEWKAFKEAYDEWLKHMGAYAIEMLKTSDAKHILMRSARDRLIDLLGIGETYPLQDVPVQGEQLTVDFDKSSTFFVDPAQEDVDYELFDGDAPAVVPEGSEGVVRREGAKVELTGPRITVDKTFRVRATKKGSERRAFLFQKATVKVGLKTDLTVSTVGADFLHPGLTKTTDPRIVDYDSEVSVKIEGVQASARYALKYVGPDGAEVPDEASDKAPDPQTGDLILRSKKLKDDTSIKVRVTRTFEPSDNRPNLKDELKATLPIAVRADPTASVSIGEPPLIDPAGDTTITISGAQASVEYTAFVRTLADKDFKMDAGRDVVTISVPASLDAKANEVRVYIPRWSAVWEAQEGFSQKGEPKWGSEDPLPLSLGKLHEDSVIVVRARKDHGTVDPSNPPGESAMQLKPVVALARPVPPDQPPGLTLEVTPSSDNARGAMLVRGGQRGVFYRFREVGGATQLGLPAYFHRLDEQRPEQNRGIGQLEIDVDFVISREPQPAPDEPFVDLASRRPPDPLVDIAPLPQGDALSVTAVKVRTGVAWLTPKIVPIKKL